MDVEAGVPPMTVIQAATINVARTFHKDKDYGSVEPGKVADLSIVEGNPLQDMWATTNVKMVVTNGKPVDIGFHKYVNPIPEFNSWQQLSEHIEVTPLRGDARRRADGAQGAGARASGRSIRCCSTAGSSRRSSSAATSSMRSCRPTRSRRSACTRSRSRAAASRWRNPTRRRWWCASSNSGVGSLRRIVHDRAERQGGPSRCCSGHRLRRRRIRALFVPGTPRIVMAGLVPAISMRLAQCFLYRDRRDIRAFTPAFERVKELGLQPASFPQPDMARTSGQFQVEPVPRLAAQLVTSSAACPPNGRIRRLWSATDAPPSDCWRARATTRLPGP